MVRLLLLFEQQFLVFKQQFSVFKQQCLNNITHFFIYFFTHMYFIQTTLLKISYQMSSETLKFVCKMWDTCHSSVWFKKKLLYIFHFICTTLMPKSYYSEFLYINLILNLTIFLEYKFLLFIFWICYLKNKILAIVLEVRCGGSCFYYIE